MITRTPSGRYFISIVAQDAPTKIKLAGMSTVEASWSGMPIGLAGSSLKYDVSVTGGLSKPVTVSSAPSTLRADDVIDDLSVLSAVASSSASPLLFESPGVQQDTLSISGKTSRVGEYKGTIAYSVSSEP